MAKSHVGAADDINQVIAGLEAQRRRQETKATEAQELLQQVQRLYQEVSEKQQHCRNANRHCGSNKLGGAERDRSSQRKLLRSFASCNKAPTAPAAQQATMP